MSSFSLNDYDDDDFFFGDTKNVAEGTELIHEEYKYYYQFIISLSQNNSLTLVLNFMQFSHLIQY